MGTVTTVILAILVFGGLIFIHEFGHYITARIFKVTITEFSIGMGPRLVWYDSKKTGIRYTLAMFPFGGFVSMPGESGEDEETADDPNRFDKKPAWQRFIIVGAGAFVNLLAGFIIMIIITSVINIGSTTVARFVDTEAEGYEVSSADSGLMVNDEIIKVNGKSVSIVDELSYEIMRNGYEPVDLVVIRGGEEITLEDVVFPTKSQQGETFGALDFYVYRAEKSFFGVLDTAMEKSFLIVRMCWESIYDLITGRYSLAAVSGPVGISSAIGEAAQDEESTSLWHIVALISINLGVMNLLPIPALDGAKMLTLLFEMVTKKRVPARIEGVINAVGLALLLGLSFVVLIKDVFQLFG